MSENKRKKEIEVIEVEWERNVYSENDRVVKKYFQMACALGANLMMTCYGLVVPSSAFMIPQLENPESGFGISVEEGSWLASIMVLGSLTGSVCGGFQSSFFGRKKSLMFDCIVYVIGTLIVALSPNFHLILLGRYIHGHSSASAMVAIPIYTSEISQPQVRKTTGSFTLICYASGFALALVLGALFPWRWALGVILIAPVGCFFILMFCPETPVWYIDKGKDKEAKESLIKLRGEDNMDIVEAEFNRISLNFHIEQKEKELNSDHQESRFKTIFESVSTSSFWKPFGFLMVVFPMALEWTGLPAVGFYMVPLLQKSKIPFDPFWASALLATYRALLSILGSPLATKCKRRSIYLSCCTLMIAGLLSLSAYTYFNQNEVLTENFPIAQWIPIFSIMVMYTGFSLGFGSIPYMLQGELLPSSARSFGSGLLGIIDNFSLFISTKMVPTWNELFGIHGTFLMYACICGLVATTSCFFMPETSGMTLEEIEAMYKPKGSKKKITQ